MAVFSTLHLGRRERFSDCLETVLEYSGGLLESFGGSSPTSRECEVGRERRSCYHLLHFASCATPSLFEMAAVAAVFRGVLVIRGMLPRLTTSCLCPSIGYGERSLVRLEVVHACSGDSPESVKTTSPRIQLTSHFGVSRGRRFVCLLPSSSFSKMLILVKVITSPQHSFHSLSGHP